MKIRSKALILASLFFSFNAYANDELLYKSGEKVFKRKCMMCHSIKETSKRKIGPSLYNIYMAKVAQNDKFKYSKAMAALKGQYVWNDSELDLYLKNPRKRVKGTKMAFAGLKKQQDRDSIVYFLKQSSLTNK